MKVDKHQFEEAILALMDLLPSQEEFISEWLQAETEWDCMYENEIVVIETLREAWKAYLKCKSEHVDDPDEIGIVDGR